MASTELTVGSVPEKQACEVNTSPVPNLLGSVAWMDRLSKQGGDELSWLDTFLTHPIFRHLCLHLPGRVIDNAH